VLGNKPKDVCTYTYSGILVVGSDKAKYEGNKSRNLSMA